MVVPAGSLVAEVAASLMAAGLLRILIADDDSNVVLLKVACPVHATKIVQQSGRRHRFKLSPCRGCGFACNWCEPT